MNKYRLDIDNCVFLTNSEGVRRLASNGQELFLAEEVEKELSDAVSAAVREPSEELARLRAQVVKLEAATQQLGSAKPAPVDAEIRQLVEDLSRRVVELEASDKALRAALRTAYNHIDDTKRGRTNTSAVQYRKQQEALRVCKTLLIDETERRASTMARKDAQSTKAAAGCPWAARPSGSATMTNRWIIRSLKTGRAATGPTGKLLRFKSEALAQARADAMNKSAPPKGDEAGA